MQKKKLKVYFFAGFSAKLNILTLAAYERA